MVGVTAITAIVSGAAPAFQIGRTDVNAILKHEGRGSSSFGAGKLSKVLVIGEVALSCALLVGAGLMTKSITKFSNYDYKFDTENLFTARIGLFETAFPDREDRARFWERLKVRLEGLPAARAVTLTNSLPGTGAGRNRFGFEGETYETDQDYPRARVATVATDFFRTFGVDIVRGRDFALQDDADALEVVLVNQPFVDRFFSGDDPIGRRIKEGTSESEGNWKTIVGVVPDMDMEGFDPGAEGGAGYYVATPVDPFWRCVILLMYLHL